MSGIDELGKYQKFFVKKFHEAAYTEDPDGVLEDTLTILEDLRADEEEMLAGLLDLFDPDLCPVRYLPYLAYTLGVRLRADYTEVSKREQIKTAIRWYKEKGKPYSFEILAKSLGFVVFVHELWTDGTACKRASELWGEDYADGEDLPIDGIMASLGSAALTEGEWKPHSRIDIETEEINIDTVDWPTLITFMRTILPRFEEVRPIHILIRGLQLNFTFNDWSAMPSEAMDGIVKAHFSDRFWIGGEPTCLHYFYQERDNVIYDGNTIDGHSDWLHHPRWYGYTHPFVDPMIGLYQAYDYPKDDTGGLVRYDANHAYRYDCKQHTDLDLTVEDMELTVEALPDYECARYDGQVPRYDGRIQYLYTEWEDELEIRIFENGVLIDTQYIGTDKLAGTSALYLYDAAFKGGRIPTYNGELLFTW